MSLELATLVAQQCVSRISVSGSIGFIRCWYMRTHMPHHISVLFLTSQFLTVGWEFIWVALARCQLCRPKTMFSQGFSMFSGNRKILYESQEVFPGLDHSQAEDHQETQGIPTFSMGSQRSFLPWAGSSFGLPLRAASSAGRKPCFSYGISRFSGNRKIFGACFFSWLRP